MDGEDNFEKKRSGDLYSTLGVTPKATKDEIKNAYHKQCQIYHPNSQANNMDDNAVDNKTANEFFHKIKYAYEVLSDDKMRDLYDTYGYDVLHCGLELSQVASMTEDEIRRKIEKNRNQNMRKQGRSSLGLDGSTSGSFGMKLSLGDLHEPTEDGGLQFPIDTLGCSMSQDIVIKPSGSKGLQFSVGGEMSTLMKGKPPCKAKFGVNYGVNDKVNLSSNAGFTGDGMELSLGLQHQIDESSDQSLMFQSFFSGSQGGLMLPMFQYSNSRTLTPHSRASMTITGPLSPQSVMTFVYQPFDWLPVVTQCSAGWKMGPPFSPRDDPSSRDTFFVDIKGVLAISKRLVMKTGIHSSVSESLFDSLFSLETLPLESAKFSISAERQIARDTFVHLTYSVRASPTAHMAFKMALTRSNHTVSFPLLLPLDPDLKNWFYLFLGFMATVTVFDVAMQIYEMNKKMKKIERRRQRYAEKVTKDRLEALQQISLMQNTVQRRRQEEESKRGMVIVTGTYGDLESEDKMRKQDITDPLQLLVDESHIELGSQSKAGLMGFFDPCPGEPKKLYVRYLFKDALHEHTFDDLETIFLPLESHMMK